MEDRLKKFAQVVDSGGFSKAAYLAHVSQPALTAAVKKLERELGSNLLERNNKSITLTPAGHLAYQTAKQLRTDVSNLRQKLKMLAAVKQSIRLGMIDSVADLLAGDDGFTRLKQVSDLSLVVDSSRKLTEAVIGEQLDAAIIVGGHHQLPDIIAADLIGHEPLVLVLHPKLTSFYQRAIKSKRLPNFLSYNASSHSYQHIDSWLSKGGFSPKPTFHSTSPEVILKLVLLGQGTAILPYGMVQQYIASSELAAMRIRHSVISRPIYAVKLQHRNLLPEIEWLFDSTTKHLKKLASESIKS